VRVLRDRARDQAREELEREQQRSDSREKQAVAKLEDQKKVYEIREKRFKRMQEQLAKAEIMSPADGIVRYGGSDGIRRFAVAHVVEAACFAF
jgi:multidrug efflux pump subunit AcrA (membrane-fusion protein)